MLKLKCPQMVLNFIKYLAFGLCILYVVDSNKNLEYYFQKGGLIGIGMVLVEYLLTNICRDMRENFTSLDTVGEEKPIESAIPSVSTDTPDVANTDTEAKSETKPVENTIVPAVPAKEDEDLNKMVDESILEKEIMNEEPIESNEQNIEYGYSFVHPSAMKLPVIRIPKCIQDSECNVCPVMMGGTADLMQVKPTKKPKECDNEY